MFSSCWPVHISLIYEVRNIVNVELSSAITDSNRSCGSFKYASVNRTHASRHVAQSFELIFWRTSAAGKAIIGGGFLEVAISGEL